MNISPGKYDFRGNLLSQIFLFWAEKLFLNGFRNTLKENDLFPCPSEHLSEQLHAKFDKYWKVELGKKGKPDTKITLAKTVMIRFFIAGIFFLIESLFVLSQSVLISHFVTLFTDSSGIGDYLLPSLAYAVTISVIIFSLMINRAISNNYIYYNGMQLRIICTNALFKKTMRLQLATLHHTLIGHVIYLISNDVYKLEFGAVYCPHVDISLHTIILNCIDMGLYWPNRPYWYFIHGSPRNLVYIPPVPSSVPPQNPPEYLKPGIRH